MIDEARRTPYAASLRKWAEIAVLLALALLLLRDGILPGWRRLNTDFPNYYIVARLMRGGYSLDRIYDWVWLQGIKDHWGLDQPFVGFIGLTPSSAWPLLPLALLPALTAKRIWILVNLCFLGVSVELLGRTTALGRARVWILCLLCVLPLRTSFLFGQMHIAVLLLVALAYWFERNGRPVLCGLCLGLAGALKVYPALFIFYFLWKRRWREALSIAGCVGVVVAAGYLCMGAAAINEFLFEQLPGSIHGGIDPYNVQLSSASAFFHRLFVFEPDLNPLPLFDSTALFSALYPLWQVLILFPVFAVLRLDREDEALDWPLFLITLLLISPVPSTYHFVVLIAAIVPLVDALWRRGRRAGAVTVVVLYGLICVLNPPVGNAGPVTTGILSTFRLLWVRMLLWGGLVLYLWRTRGVSSQRTLLAASAFVCFWIWEFAGYQAHFSYLPTDFARRIKLPAPSMLATQPVARQGGFAYTAMHGNGYAVIDQDGHEVGAATDSGDAPAVSPDGRRLAFRMEVNHRRQLAVMELSNRQPKLLTSGDCDAYTPAWLDESTIIYATDCGRGVGLTALARVNVDQP